MPCRIAAIHKLPDLHVITPKNNPMEKIPANVGHGFAVREK
jgi:hypothetical protein